MIETKNLRLIVCERVHIEAILRDKHELGSILQVGIPDSWPTFPEAFSLSPNDSDGTNQGTTEWPGYFFVNPTERVLVGNGGFTREPDGAGNIELGYEIASEYWNRGFATEAVQGMLGYAFAHTVVQMVIAHTLAHVNASNRVLQKVGMTFDGEIDDPEEGKIWRWHLSRDNYMGRLTI